MATLSHSEFGVPYGPLAVALLRGADLAPKPDATMARDAPALMTFPSGCASVTRACFFFRSFAEQRCQLPTTGEGAYDLCKVLGTLPETLRRFFAFS